MHNADSTPANADRVRLLAVSSTPAAIFDIDGVLVDSYEAHLVSWSSLAQETGASFDRESFDAAFGRTSREIIQQFWPQRSGSETSVRDLDDRKESLYRAIITREFPAMDGAVEVIDALLDAGFRLAAGSSGPLENVELALSGLGRRSSFSAIVTGHDVSRGKPDPQVFLLASERLGISPARCCVIEDAPAGIEAARRAGMVCVGLVSTGRKRDQLAAADLVVDSLRELTPQRIRGLIANRLAI